MEGRWRPAIETDFLLFDGSDQLTVIPIRERERERERVGGEWRRLHLGERLLPSARE